MKDFLIWVAVSIGSLFGIHSQPVTPPVSIPVQVVQTQLANGGDINQTIKSTLPIHTSNPPAGYMIPDQTEIPIGYSLSNSGFTDHSALYDFRGNNHNQELSFIETNTSYLSQSLANVMSFPGAKAIKSFVYQNRQGVVTGDFENNLYEGSPASPTKSQPYNEYYLLYDHNGRLVEIHTYDVSVLTPDKLIQILEEMKISQ
jgi:hypothetical protein